uniref:Uncharacterized protein n=1 Tax=Arundo donax TaxID=35708 RepID=A0A0A9D4R6_ARUDO
MTERGRFAGSIVINMKTTRGNGSSRNFINADQTLEDTMWHSSTTNTLYRDEVADTGIFSIKCLILFIPFLLVASTSIRLIPFPVKKSLHSVQIPQGLVSPTAAQLKAAENSLAADVFPVPRGP